METKISRKFSEVDTIYNFPVYNSATSNRISFNKENPSTSVCTSNVEGSSFNYMENKNNSTINPDLYIYPNSYRLCNAGRTVQPTTIIYLYSTLIEDYLLKSCYAKSSNLVTEPYVWMMLDFAFITNLAYTYCHTGEDVITINPHYRESLYQAYYYKKNMETPANKKISQLILINDFIKEYLTMEVRGKVRIENYEKKYICSTYRVTDKLKELAKRMMMGEGRFIATDLNEILKICGKGVPFPSTEKTYFIAKDSKGIVYKIRHAHKWIKKYCLDNNLSNLRCVYPYERAIRTYCTGVYTMEEIDSMPITKSKWDYDTNYRIDKPTVAVTMPKVDRKAIEKILRHPVDEDGKPYETTVINELYRMYSHTTDEDCTYKVEYYKAKQGRYYSKNSNIQCLPKKIREKVLSEYIAVDMNCAIFSLMKNMGRKCGYKKETPEIDKMINDRKSYRMQFVNERLDYEAVKKIMTAISYGATVDIYNMYMSCNEPSLCKRESCLMHMGYNKEAVLNMCATSEMQDLVKELHNISKHIIKKHVTGKSITNECGGVLDIRTRKNFGTKLAHIYQSYEGAILHELTNVKIGNKPLGLEKNGIGLLLHDGIYIKKSVAKEYDLCKLFSEHIKEKMGFDVKYEYE